MYLVGSVKLLNHAQLLTLKNVHHLFSEVQGRIKYRIKSSLKFLLDVVRWIVSGVQKVKTVNLMGNLEDGQKIEEQYWFFRIEWKCIHR